jgi:hypothetical protein
MKSILQTSLTLFLTLQVGCQSTLAISTFPNGATVFNQGKSLGVTPLSIEESTLTQNVAGGHLFVVEMANYKRIWIWIPEGVGGSYSLNLASFALNNESSAAKETSELVSRQNLYKISKQFIEAHNLIFNKKDSEATTLIEQMKKDYSAVGTVYYLDAVQKLSQNKNDEALKSIKIAAELAPDVVEFTVLYNRLGGEKASAKTNQASATTP